MQKKSSAKRMVCAVISLVLGYAGAFAVLTAYGVVDLGQPGLWVMAIVILCVVPFVLRLGWENRAADNNQVAVRQLDFKMIVASLIALLLMLAIPSWQVPVSFAFLGLLFFAWLKQRAVRRRAAK